jgi:glycosyltransferase involved in cell wall biosynthesis
VTERAKEKGRRILIATPWMGFWEVGARGGVPDEYLTFRTLVRRGHELHVVAPEGADYVLPGEGPGSLTVHPVPYPAQRWRGSLKGQLGRVRDLWLAHRAYAGVGGAVARRIDPDLILAHTFHTAPWMARVGARLGVPVVGKFFGVLTLDSRWSPSFVHFLRHAEHYLAFRAPLTQVIVLDDGTGGDRAALKLGVPRERLRFWPNGTNVEWGDRDLPAGGGDPAARARLGLDPERIYTFTLANLLPLKRLDRLLAALAELGRPGDPPITGLVGGDGVMRAALERQAMVLGLGDRIRFLGAVDHDRVPELMAAANIYVAPHDLTNAGIPTCEAMLCRLPVVAVDRGATRRLVLDGETGFVVPPDDAAALAGAIRRLAADPELRRRMGSRGHVHAREGFVSWEARVGMEVELLESLAQSLAGTPAGPDR